MRRLCFAMALALPAVALAGVFAAAPAGAQTSGFDGAYRLTLSFGSTCHARIPSVSIALLLRESTVAQGSELTGRPTRSDETSVAQITLLRSGSTVHGGFSTQGGGTEREPITSNESWLFMPWLMLDGAVTTSSDRPRASGTAFGFLAAGSPEEDYPSSLASCTGRDFSWALDPQ